MSCWRRTAVLRIPAISLGFVYLWEWNEFLAAHEEEFDWEPGFFAASLSDSYLWDDYSEWLRGKDRYDPRSRLDLNVYPELAKSVPGPFLDYCLEETIPLSPEENTCRENDCARPLTQEEKEKYLPLYRRLFPGFTLKDMDDVHYCQYEWYDGADAPYLY